MKKRTSSPKKRITSPQFVAAAIIAKVSPDRAAVARSVLVDGMTYSSAVAPFGWTRQAAYVPVRSIEQGLRRYQDARAAEAAEQARIDALPPAALPGDALATDLPQAAPLRGRLRGVATARRPEPTDHTF